jgi:ABC-type phosphate transport system substrate-binding protein
MRLLLEETPAGRFSGGEEIAIRLGAPAWAQPYFATQIGEEQIVIVINPQNPLSTLSNEMLRQLYSGQVTEWSELETSFDQPVQVWDYPPGEDLHEVFVTALWGASPQPILAYLAPDPDAMLVAVSATPGALGYLPRSWLGEGDLITVAVEEKLSSALRQPVLLLTADEPQGLLRAWLSCLQ